MRPSLWRRTTENQGRREHHLWCQRNTGERCAPRVTADRWTRRSEERLERVHFEEFQPQSALKVCTLIRACQNAEGEGFF